MVPSPYWPRYSKTRLCSKEFNATIMWKKIFHFELCSTIKLEPYKTGCFSTLLPDLSAEFLSQSHGHQKWKKKSTNFILVFSHFFFLTSYQLFFLAFLTSLKYNDFLYVQTFSSSSTPIQPTAEMSLRYVLRNWHQVFIILILFSGNLHTLLANNGTIILNN